MCEASQAVVKCDTVCEFTESLSFLSEERRKWGRLSPCSVPPGETRLRSLAILHNINFRP